MPWKRRRRRLKMEWSCGRPGCTHRFRFIAWLHGLLPPLGDDGNEPDGPPGRQVRDIDPPTEMPITRSEVDEFARRVSGPGASKTFREVTVPNIITSLQQEISRVEKLLEVLDSITRGEAQTAIRFGRQSLAQNSLEGMYEALADLRDFTAEPKR